LNCLLYICSSLLWILNLVLRYMYRKYFFLLSVLLLNCFLIVLLFHFLSLHAVLNFNAVQIVNLFIVSPFCVLRSLPTSRSWRYSPRFSNRSLIISHAHLHTAISCIYIKANMIFFCIFFNSVQFSSVAQLCLTLCDPMNRSTPGLPVHHQLLEFIQTHVHWVGDAVQPSHPLSSPSPPAPNPSQHQSLVSFI